MTNASTIAGLFSSQRGYDAASNVTAVNTTLVAVTGGTDNQAFCYDEQNRLTWAGSSGTPSCGGTLTSGSLTSANYTQTFAYDTLDRLTSGPLGSYTYGDSAHLHAVTSIGSGGTTSYTASYDTSGDMTCRAPDTMTTCAGTQTGAQLGYDNEGRLSTWQNTPSSPTTSDSFLYDGAGHRVEQSVTVNGSITTTTTYVAGGLEEISANGVSTTLTKYFTGAGGLPTAERVGTNGPLPYLASDGQGTVSEALDGGGNVTFAQLYTPYGNARYSSGSSPTTLGYTGQRADSTTGLDYYQARYYDPVAGQFGSADTVNDGLNRYGYVAGNPSTYTDPSGHKLYNGEDGDVAPHKSPPPGPTTNWPNYRSYLRNHMNDGDNFGPLVMDFRTFDGDLKKYLNLPECRTPEENKETEDAYVLAKYFGLSVWIHDRTDGTRQSQDPPRADYTVGIDRMMLDPLSKWGAAFYQDAVTPMDLYYPGAGTPQGTIDRKVREKSTKQAPVVVVDMSNNAYLQDLYARELADPNNPALYNFGLSLTSSNRGSTVPQRVIFIDNGVVVEDIDQYGFGPDPANIA